MITVTNWGKFQHYKKEKPPWVKLYRDCLGDYGIMYNLEPEERWVLVGIWMLAAETNNKIPNDTAFLSDRLKSKVSQKTLAKMQSLGFIDLGGESRDSLEEVYTDSRQALALEEERREENIVCDLFEKWWNAYGRKIGRKSCERMWCKLTDEQKQACLDAAPAYVASTPDVKYRKHPQTYLRGHHWEDEINAKPEREETGHREYRTKADFEEIERLEREESAKCKPLY